MMFQMIRAQAPSAMKTGGNPELFSQLENVEM